MDNATPSSVEDTFDVGDYCLRVYTTSSSGTSYKPKPEVKKGPTTLTVKGLDRQWPGWYESVNRTRSIDDAAKLAQKLVDTHRPDDHESMAGIIGAAMAAMVYGVWNDSNRHQDGRYYFDNSVSTFDLLVEGLAFFIRTELTTLVRPAPVSVMRWNRLLDPKTATPPSIPKRAMTWLAEMAKDRLPKTRGFRAKAHLERLIRGESPPGWQITGSTKQPSPSDTVPISRDLYVALGRLASDPIFLASIERMEGMRRWTVPSAPLETLLLAYDAHRAVANLVPNPADGDTTEEVP